MNQITEFQKTMSSLEIAELTGKDHRNVTRDIEEQLGKLDGGVLRFEQTYIHPQNGQSYKMYQLPKRETLILVSGYSVELRAKIIDRWEELERQSQPKTQIEIILAQAQALVDIERKQAIQEQKQALQERRLEQLENKVEKKQPNEFLEQLVTPTQIGAMFEPAKSGKEINRLLKDYNLQWKVDGQWVPREHGKKYCSYDYIQLDSGKTVPQLLWQRKVKELIT